MSKPDYLRECLDTEATEPAKSPITKRLLTAAATAQERYALYGPNYAKFGCIMFQLMPTGFTPRSVKDWNRIGVLTQCITKLMRYAEQLPAGGHADSAHDLSVYGAILREVTEDG